jgi:hypothetical protein
MVPVHESLVMHEEANVHTPVSTEPFGWDGFVLVTTRTL